MKSFTAALALAAVAPAVMAQQTVMVNTLIGVVQCEPIKFTWTGGTPPYYLSLIPAQQPQAPPMKIFPTQQGNSYTWLVDLGAGTAFTTVIKDSSGTPNYSSEQVVQNGTDSSCLNASVTETDTSGNGPTTAPASTSSLSPAAAAVTGSGTSSVSHTSTSPTTSNTAPAPTNTNAAVAGYSASIGAYGLAGIVGLIGAAFL